MKSFWHQCTKSKEKGKSGWATVGQVRKGLFLKKGAFDLKLDSELELVEKSSF